MADLLGQKEMGSEVAGLAGRIERKLYANASSPTEGMVDGSGSA